jgi:signal transduction histidine kinase
MRSSLGSLLGLWPWVADAVVVLVATVVGLAAVFGASPAPPPLSPVGYAVLLAHVLPIPLRRRFPRTVLAVALVSGAAFRHLGVPPFVTGPVVLLPIYSVAAQCPRPTSLAVLGAAVLALATVGLDAGGWVTWALVFGGAWSLGHYVRTRRLYTAALEERARELERAREELARQAVAEERLRIARELHDVVAHSMSVIAVQSGVGAHVIDSQPDEARKALAAIEATSRSALREMRRLLGVLRDEPASPASLAPAPRLSDLDGLVAQVADAGLLVDVQVDGARPEVPAGVDVTAYRIVQEALTNVIRHAGTQRARVAIRYREQEVAIEVTDDGRGAPPGDGPLSRGGLGIAGLRERVAVYGGELEAGPRPEGGFRVAARLPFEGAGR